MKQTLIAMLLCAPILSFADDQAVKKYRDFTPQQIKELPEKVRSSSLPIMYTQAAGRGLAVDAELLFGMQLNSLMYSGLHDYPNAVKAFQADLGDKPTGVLTVWQIHNLELRSDMQKLARVLFPDQFSSVKLEKSAAVQGTMVIIDDRIAYPINHVKVNCLKEDNYCRLDQIHLAIPDENSWSQSYHVMDSDPEYFEITHWGDDNIETAPKETSGGCRTVSLSLNFKTKEFYYMTRNAGGKCEILGASLGKLAKPRIAQILDGEKIIQDEFGKIYKGAYAVLASAFRKKVDNVNANEQKK